MSNTTASVGTEASLLLTFTPEPDGSYSFGIEDTSLPEDDPHRYMTGLSEGMDKDLKHAAEFAGFLVAQLVYCIATGTLIRGQI